MKDLLALSVNGTPIQAPDNIPVGGANQVGNIISWGINVGIVLGTLVALGFLVYGGIIWITSGGDKQKIDKARKTLTYAIVGLILMTMGFVVIKFLGDALGIKYF